MMITQKDIKEILSKYDKDNITIGVLGGHSGLDVCRGAKKLGFKTLAVCQKGRERTYDKYYKSNCKSLHKGLVSYHSITSLSFS